MRGMRCSTRTEARWSFCVRWAAAVCAPISATPRIRIVASKAPRISPLGRSVRQDRGGGRIYAEARAIGPLATFEADDTWVEHPYRAGVVLIGDAAATTDPTIGQGMSLTLRDARVLRDQLLSHDDCDAAGHRYAEHHDQAYAVIHTVEGWLKDLLLETGPDAEARRARALPLIGQDGTRMPDLFGLGPDVPIGETVRRRFFLGGVEQSAANT